MSEIDDLLNYELGDVDDQELAADEDELLLSDEEAAHTKLSDKQANLLLDESEEWVSLELAKASVKENKKSDHELKEKANINNKKSQSITKKNEVSISSSSSSTEVTTTEINTEKKVINLKPKINRAALKKTLIKSDEVTSSVQDSNDDKLLKDEMELSVEVIPDISGSEYEEDADERNERLNPKTTVERGFITDGPELSGPRTNIRGYARGSRGISSHRGGRHFGPRSQIYGQRPQYSPHQINDMYNNVHQFHSIPGQMMGPPQNPMYNINNLNDHPPPNGPRMDYRGPPPHNFRPHPDMRLPGPHQHQSMGPRTNDFIHMRGARPDFLSNQHDNIRNFRPFNPIIRPGGPPHHPRFDQMRPRLPHNTSFMNQSQQLQQQSFMGSQHPGNIMIVRTNEHLSGLHQSLPTIGINSQQPVLPRKILINPNFKRGVEAAKNQLMIDNLQFIGQQHHGQQHQMQSDDELLRQQEAFINQNRMHIEKRRHERSPEREYTPPPRRDSRRPYSREREHGNNGGRNVSFRGRTRRDGFDSKLQPKRRRSESIDRDFGMNKEKTEEEDEETRVYRLEIEKQKAQREKILREKEERRKRAAEEKSKDLIIDKKTGVVPITTTVLETVDTIGTQKLTPIVVKKSKIISLKKKTQENFVQKQIPTAKIIPETKKVQQQQQEQQQSLNKDMNMAMAVVKPVIKTKPTLIIKNITDDESDLDEDALLADSPPQTPIETTFRGRRVVLKSTTTTDSQKLLLKTLHNSGSNSNINVDDKHKGIFARLEKKISVNDASKRTIQRIVLDNSE